MCCAAITIYIFQDIFKNVLSDSRLVVVSLFYLLVFIFPIVERVSEEREGAFFKCLSDVGLNVVRLLRVTGQIRVYSHIKRNKAKYQLK